MLTRCGQNNSPWCQSFRNCQKHFYEAASEGTRDRAVVSNTRQYIRAVIVLEDADLSSVWGKKTNRTLYAYFQLSQFWSNNESTVYELKLSSPPVMLFLILTFYNYISFFRTHYRHSYGSKCKRSKKECNTNSSSPLCHWPSPAYPQAIRVTNKMSFQQYSLHVYIGLCCLISHSKTSSVCICSRFWAI